MLSPPIKLPLNLQARNAFFFHYVTNDLRTYNCLQAFSTFDASEKHLDASVDAVSLAFFSHWAGSQLAMDRAKECYVLALELISEAIRVPETASCDATLLAALLLDLFEKMTSRVPESSGPWVSHVNGAFSLVRSRGQNQFKHPLGIQLLVRLCNNLLISCVASHQPIPVEFISLRRTVARSVDSNNPKWRLGGLMVRFVELRQVVKSDAVPPHGVIDLAKCLDDDFSALVDEMPPTWQYDNIMANDGPTRVYGNCYHVYRDAHVTQTWNVLRLARILIWEFILDRCSRLAEACTSSSDFNGIFKVYEAARDSVEILAGDICASVPQYAGLGTETLPKDCEGSKQHHRMHCYTLLFPLFVAAQSPTVPSGIRNWIMMQLRHMSNNLRVRNAEVVLTILSREKWVEPWSVYAMLGSYAFVA